MFEHGSRSPLHDGQQSDHAEHNDNDAGFHPTGE
jgi:hypothetical protein